MNSLESLAFPHASCVARDKISQFFTYRTIENIVPISHPAVLIDAHFHSMLLSQPTDHFTPVQIVTHKRQIEGWRATKEQRSVINSSLPRNGKRTSGKITGVLAYNARNYASALLLPTTTGRVRHVQLNTCRRNDRSAEKKVSKIRNKVK